MGTVLRSRKGSATALGWAVGAHRARENIRDALSLWYDDADTATIVDRIELAPALKEELATTEELARGMRG